MIPDASRCPGFIIFAIVNYLKNIPFVMFFVLAFVTLVSNSCKKDTTGTVESLFSGGKWELASITVENYSGDTLKRTDVLNVNCDKIQSFVFNADNTCTYENFSCISQTGKGRWQYDKDTLLLKVPQLLLKDTLPGGRDTTYAPFARARILNLGEYSMVLQTGEVNRFATSRRKITRFGFVRPNQ
jgi:hypothetical protein